MIDFEVVHSAVAAWWETLGVQTLFQDQKQPFTKAHGLTKGITVFLNIIAIATNGVDEVDYDTVAPNAPNGILPRVSGIRHLTLSCRVESNDHSPNKAARYWCEKARTRLRMPSVRTALQAAGLAQIETTTTVDLPIVRDDRVVSRAAFDVRFGVLASETEAATGAMGTIGSIEITSNTFKNVDGNATVVQTDETITEP